MKTHDTKLSVFVALVHETLKTGRFETLADLTDVVKWRAAKLRFRYDSALIAKAIDQVEQVKGVFLVGELAVRPVRIFVPAPLIVPVTNLATLRAELERRFGRLPMKRMPKPGVLDYLGPVHAAKLRILMADIRDSALRSAELEALVEQPAVEIV